MSPALPPAFSQFIHRAGPLAAITLLHVGFFYALQSGLLRDAAKVVLPKAVMVNFISPEQPKPQPPTPQPAQPKTVPVVKKAAPPPPQPPMINTTPSERAISTPPLVAPEPPLPAVAAAPPSPPAAPSPAPAASLPRTVSSGIEYIQPPQPAYPPASRRLGEEGKVILRVLVNEKGRPEQAEIQKTSEFARLDEAARQAALRAVFKPHIEDGRPVAVFAIIPIRFQLDS